MTNKGRVAHVTPSSAGATLAGRLTPPGEGGICVIALIGPNADSILARLFSSPRNVHVADIPPGRIAYGSLRRNGILLDEVIVECESANRVKVYAINCHGGAVASQRVLDALAAEGATESSSAELLDRRKELGLLGTAETEAARLIPKALTLRGAKALLDQYRGALSAELRRITALLESGKISQAEQALKALAETARYGRGMTEPPTLVIAGRPNVGKSTLGNALLRHDRLIVHHEPGTTRDTIEEVVAIQGIPFLLTDTAGIRDTAHEIEAEGVKRSLAALKKADIVLLVFDSSAPLADEDLQLARAAAGMTIVPTLNKTDLPPAIDEAELRRLAGGEPVRISSKSGEGLEELERRIIATAYPKIPPAGAALCFTARQETLLREALEGLEAGTPDRATEAISRLVEPL